MLDAVGPIPEELQNLTRLTNLYVLSTFLHEIIWEQLKHPISSVLLLKLFTCG